MKVYYFKFYTDDCDKIYVSDDDCIHLDCQQDDELERIIISRADVKDMIRVLDEQKEMLDRVKRKEEQALTEQK